MADNVEITAGTGTTIATDDAGAGGHVQVVKLAISTDGSATPIPAEATNGLDVDVTRVKPDGTNTMPSLDAAARRGYVQVTDGSNSASVTNSSLQVTGGIAHDGVDAGNPIKMGAVAIAHGTNPTAVAAADRTNTYANRHGVPFYIGGHPNIVTLKHTTITTAVTDAAIISVSAGTKIVVTAFTVTLDNASTVFPTFLMGFGTANTPTTTGVIGAHGGVPAGGGFSRGDGSGIIGIGGDGEDLRVTTTGNATGNGLQITITYFTVES